MVTELAQIEVKPGTGVQFEAAVREARPLFLGAPGCRGFRLWKSIEEPGRYRLVVEWDTVEDHTVAFRASAAFARWRELVHMYFAESPKVEHQMSVELE